MNMNANAMSSPMARKNINYDEQNQIDKRFFRKHSTISLNRPMIANLENARKNATTDLYKQSFLGRTRGTGTHFNKNDETGSMLSVRSRAIQNIEQSNINEDIQNNPLMPTSQQQFDYFNRRDSQRSMSLMSQVMIKPIEMKDGSSSSKRGNNFVPNNNDGVFNNFAFIKNSKLLPMPVQINNNNNMFQNYKLQQMSEQGNANRPCTRLSSRRGSIMTESSIDHVLLQSKIAQSKFGKNPSALPFNQIFQKNQKSERSNSMVQLMMR